MHYGICNLSIVPLRFEASEKSEMISQLLFGEHFTILEKQKNWSKIKLFSDDYEGFVDNKQIEEISQDLFEKIAEEVPVFSGEIIDSISNTNDDFYSIPIGCRLPFYKNNSFLINNEKFIYEGKTFSGKLHKTEIIRNAFIFLNTSFLWGGKTPFGIDCSGFTQMVYKLCGYSLFRDAKKQATQGEVLSFIEESEPGDLAFFDDENGEIVHVGIILKDYYIIHAFGKVRIDSLDHSGIFNNELQKHTHKLRIIRKMI